MTFRYNNVYINNVGTVTGPYEAKGTFSKLFDKSYDDFYFGTKSWEQAESKLIMDSVDIVLSKMAKTKFDIDVHLCGDLLNQLVATNYAASNLAIPLMGIYAACATNNLALIIGANMVESSQIKNCICTTSSHNNAAEKQFRNPVEYGGPKPITSTFTSTGAASAYLSYDKRGIKIESATLGRVIDMGSKNVFHMGAVMAPAAAKTIYDHLNDTKRKIDYYDLILTGDLGIYGKKIFKDYMESEYGIKLNNYEDAGSILYDMSKQNVYAGASGPATMPLVTYSYVFDRMKKKELNRVLIIATGALMNTTMVNQKLTIPAVAHAVSLEVVE